MTRRLLGLAAIAAIAGCASLQAGGGGGLPGVRTVSGKEAPITLVAVDGARCEVTPARWERAKIGDRVWCAWRGHGEAPHPGRPGGIGPVGEVPPLP